MKKITKVLVVLTLSLTCMAFAAVSAYADTGEQYFKQTGYNATGVSLQWNVPSLTDQPVLWYIKDGSTGAVLWKSTNPAARAATIHNLPTGYAKTFQLYYKYYYSTQDPATEEPRGDAYVGYTYINTTPASMAKSSFGLSGVYSNSAFIQTATPQYASGCQAEIRTVSGNKVKSSNTFYSYSSAMSIAKNTAYMYRVRAYYKNPSTGKTCYGAWSSLRYFDNVYGKISSSSKKKGCKLKLKGVAGVTKYKIYVSTSSKSKGKYTKAVSPKKGKYTTYSITKMGKSKLKKKKTYYVTIVPVIKQGGKLHNSEVYGHSSFYNYK